MILYIMEWLESHQTLLSDVHAIILINLLVFVPGAFLTKKLPCWIHITW